MVPGPDAPVEILLLPEATSVTYDLKVHQGLGFRFRFRV